MKRIADALELTLVEFLGEELLHFSSEGEEIGELFNWDKHAKASTLNFPELSSFLKLPFREIDGIVLSFEEANQIANFARFLLIQREEGAEEVMKHLTFAIKKSQRENGTYFSE